MQASLQPQDGQQVPRLRARYLGQSMESMLSKGLLKSQAQKLQVQVAQVATLEEEAEVQPEELVRVFA